MITLASDFGDPYPAAMRGVVLREAPDARPVDVTHQLPRGDVRAGAFWLAFLLPEFPPAVHCCVVDPGVGTDRAALVVRAGEHVLVGPDNGLLLPPARALGGDVELFEWRYEDPASATFHGRDVFAPAAVAVQEAGADAIAGLERTERTDDYVDLRLPEPEPTAAGATGEVLVVDDFGNCITNVPGEVLPSVETVTVNGEAVPVGHSFAAVEPGERLVTVGSHGNLECDVNDGRGEAAFGLAPGDAVRFEW
jgi:S-adenosylmethionine hydrolase